MEHSGPVKRQNCKLSEKKAENEICTQLMILNTGYRRQIAVNGVSALMRFVPRWRDWKFSSKLLFNISNREGAAAGVNNKKKKYIYGPSPTPPTVLFLLPPLPPFPHPVSRPSCSSQWSETRSVWKHGEERNVSSIHKKKKKYSLKSKPKATREGKTQQTLHTMRDMLCKLKTTENTCLCKYL